MYRLGLGVHDRARGLKGKRRVRSGDKATLREKYRWKELLVWKLGVFSLDTVEALAQEKKVSAIGSGIMGKP